MVKAVLHLLPSQARLGAFESLFSLSLLYQAVLRAQQALSECFPNEQMYEQLGTQEPGPWALSSRPLRSALK